eukprot:15329924-Ditylum_brightwellii.AAC.1
MESYGDYKGHMNYLGNSFIDGLISETNNYDDIHMHNPTPPTKEKEEEGVEWSGGKKSIQHLPSVF